MLDGCIADCARLFTLSLCCTAIGGAGKLLQVILSCFNWAMQKRKVNLFRNEIEFSRLYLKLCALRYCILHPMLFIHSIAWNTNWVFQVNNLFQFSRKIKLFQSAHKWVFCVFICFWASLCRNIVWKLEHK